MYSYSKSLEDLDFVVIDGQMVYPTEQSTSQKDTIQSKPKKDQPTKKPNKEVKEVHNEHYKTYDVYCIHQTHQVNQGITGCDINQNVAMCGSCPYRKSGTIKVKVSSTSTKK